MVFHLVNGPIAVRRRRAGPEPSDSGLLRVTDGNAMANCTFHLVNTPKINIYSKYYIINHIHVNIANLRIHHESVL